MATVAKGIQLRFVGVAALPAVTVLACYGLLFTRADSASARSLAGNACPTGTREQARSCVLDSDLELHESLVLQSFTTLNCRGHRLLPVTAGTGTTPETYVASVPPVAVAVVGERGVDVRNCRIGEEDRRFDFGILAVDAKHAGSSGHRIHDNEINARDAAITLLRVDDAQLNDNVITWSSGFGITLLRDSDRNRINGNVLSSAGSPPAVVRLVPDGGFRSANDEGIFVVAQYPQPLFNVVIDGRLYQFPNFEAGQYPGNDDNVIEGNQLSLPGSSAGKAHGAIEVGGNSTRTRVIGNAIHAAGYGIRFAGGMRAQPLSRPGVCVSPAGPSQRLCATDADCFIPGIDQAPVGTCSGLVADVQDLRARETLAEDNTLVGPFNSTTAMQAGIFGGNATVGGIIRRNRILGTGIEPGITLAGNMIESGVVTGNEVHGASLVLMLQQGPATLFGAQVFLNDFTGSTSRAVGVTGTYNLPTELSWQGVGNFWGHMIPPCFRSSDTPLPGLIQDSAPFCVAVDASSSAARLESERTSSGSPRNCSGAVNCGVPSKPPVASSWRTSRVSVEMERPKSPTLTAPSASTKQFDGLMSRWRIPAACAASRPPMMSRTADTAAAAGSGPSAAMRSFSVPPRATPS